MYSHIIRNVFILSFAIFLTSASPWLSFLDSKSLLTLRGRNPNALNLANATVVDCCSNDGCCFGGSYCCGDNCCDSGDACCMNGDDAFCCEHGSGCCFNGSGAFCCQPPGVCCPNSCCNNSNDTCDENGDCVHPK